jgi:hypothetical protein
VCRHGKANRLANGATVIRSQDECNLELANCDLWRPCAKDLVYHVSQNTTHLNQVAIAGNYDEGSAFAWRGSRSLSRILSSTSLGSSLNMSLLLSVPAFDQEREELSQSMILERCIDLACIEGGAHNCKRLTSRPRRRRTLLSFIARFVVP